MNFIIEDIVINPELEKQFLSLRSGIEILSPSSLRRKMKKTFQKGLERYS